MWKQLLHRIYNERKQNTWLYVELLIVLAIIWVAFNDLYKSYQLSTLPTGTNIENCWRLRIGRSVSTSVDNQPDFSQDYTAITQIMKNIRQNNAVDAIGLTVNSMPYSSNNSNISMYLAKDSLNNKKYVHGVLIRYYNKDVMRVFRCKDIHGRPLADQIPAIEKHYIIPTKSTALKMAGHTNIVDTLVTGFDYGPMPILQIAENIRYSDYEEVMDGCYEVITKKDLSECIESEGATSNSVQVCLRMKQHMTQQDMENWLNKNKALISTSPLYINSATSFSHIKAGLNEYFVRQIKQGVFLVSFLLVCAFLGILGTFWLRTSQRRKEIGLLMAIGSSKVHIILNFIYEGLFILLCTLPLIILYIGYYITTGHLSSHEEIVIPTIITSVLSIITMSLLIIGGVLISAWSTFKIQAAEVLHDE